MQDNLSPVKVDIRCQIQGDVVLECINLDENMEHEEMLFRAMFDTAFIQSNALVLGKEDIDILWNTEEHYPQQTSEQRHALSSMLSTPLLLHSLCLFSGFLARRKNQENWCSQQVLFLDPGATDHRRSNKEVSVGADDREGFAAEEFHEVPELFTDPSCLIQEEKMDSETLSPAALPLSVVNKKMPEKMNGHCHIYCNIKKSEDEYLKVTTLFNSNVLDSLLSESDRLPTESVLWLQF